MDPKKLLGFETEADKKVNVRAGDWSAIKLALFKNKEAWEIVAREAQSIFDQCKHDPECPASTNELIACLPVCSDREKRLSALVILSAARQFDSIDARRPADGPYFAPSREHFSKVLAELGAAQTELDELRAKVTKEVP